MESNEVKKLRRLAAKFGVKFNRVNNQKGSGYRIFTLIDFSPVAAVEGIDCSHVMTIEEIADFLFAVAAEKLKTKLKAASAVNF